LLQNSWKSSGVSSPVEKEPQSSNSPAPSGREVAVPATKQHESQSTNQEEQLTDQDILKSIEDIYFSSTGFDPCRYELTVIFFLNIKIKVIQLTILCYLFIKCSGCLKSLSVMEFNLICGVYSGNLMLFLHKFCN
jgi:hypothetical protein